MTGKEYMRRRKRQDERGGKDLVKAGKSRRYLLYYQFVCLFFSLTKFPRALYNGKILGTHDS